MVERLQINESEGSGRGPGHGVFDDMEGHNEGVTLPDYDITTTLPTLSQMVEGSGRGPGHGVFDDMEGHNEGVTPPDYNITTTLPTLSQTDIGIDTTDEGIPLALVGVCVLLGVFFVGLLYSYLSRSNKGEDKKVKSLLENIEIEVAPQSMKHQSLR